MLNSEYLKNIPSADNNILHDYVNQNLSDSSLKSYTENEIDNLIFNSNLEKSNTIK